MSWRALVRAGAALVLGLCSCARLPEIARGECGNGVVEPPEDCDSFDAENGAQCRPRGAVGECHLDCNRSPDNGLGQCPSGWGCDLGGICRRPTGQFEALPELELGSAASLGAGDFDGDGHADLASFEAPSPLGETRLEVHYFDAQGLLSETRSFPKTVVAPVISDLSGEGQSDIVFSDQRLGVLLGRTDRSWVPETFSSYRIADTSILTLSVFDGNVQGTSGFIVFAAFEGVSGLYVPDTANNGLPRLLGTLRGPNEALVGSPVSGRVLEDTSQSPCLQLVLALRGESRFSLIDACARDPVTRAAVWRDMQEWSVELDPPEPISRAPQLVDVNEDGHLDVLIGTDARAYVSHGDGQGLSPGVPYRLPLAGSAGAEIAMPLATADITADGAPDFVFDDHVLMSSPSSDPGLFDYAAWNRQPPGYWSAAVIADLNGNGKLDVVAASSRRSGIDFFNGTASQALTPFRLASSRPVQHLAVGDFDGDLLNDLAFTEAGPLDAAASSVLMAFGAAAGAPLAPVPVARMSDIEQLNIYSEDGVLSHLILTSNERFDERRRGALALLIGSGDRIPTAFYELTSFATDSSTSGSVAIELATGGFTAPNAGDVVALAFREELTNQLEFWLLPALLTSVGAPVRLAGAFPSELRPVSGAGGEVSFRMASAAADFDADGRAELVLASPSEDDERCALVIMSVDSAQIVRRVSLRLDQPCTAAQLLPVDADLDERIDIVLLSARGDSTGGQLSVFWNDGQGGFSSERRLDVNDPGHSPLAFSVLAPTPTRGFSFVYATADALELVSIADATRDLGGLSTLADVQGCTGLVAADVNGDGATDLAFAKQGNLSVLKASLESL